MSITDNLVQTNGHSQDRNGAMDQAPPNPSYSASHAPDQSSQAFSEIDGAKSCAVAQKDSNHLRSSSSSSTIAQISGLELSKHPETPDHHVPQPKNLSESTDSHQNGLETNSPTTDTPVPTTAQLLEAILPIRSSAPTLGLPKLLSKLKELNPTWQLSEKRLRKFLNSNPNLSPQAALRTSPHTRPSAPRPPCEPMRLPDYAWEKDWDAASAENSSTEPISSLDDTLLLECRQRSVKVEPVRFPASNKGSGLISKDHIPRGIQIIKEDAFVWVPPNKNMSRSVISGQSCAFCGRAFSMQRTKNQPHCPHHPAPGSKEAIASQQLITTTSTSLTTGSQSVTEKPAGPEPCYMRFCTRVCAQRSVDYYGPLVCPQRNPEYMQLIRYSDSEEFRGAHMVFKIFARMLIANETGEVSLEPAFKPSELTKAEEERNEDLNHEAKAEQTNGDLETDQNGSDDPITTTNGNSTPTGTTKRAKKTKSKKKVTNTNQVPESSGTSVEFEKIVNRIQGLATISDRARRERFHGGGHLGSHFTDARYGQLWRNGWHTVIRALHLDTGYRSSAIDNSLHTHENSSDQFWNNFWKRRMSAQTIAHYFGLKSFLEFVGRVALNREVDHGLYLLHSRFNHSCDPNAVVLKHPGSEEIHKIAPSTIYVMSKKDIAKDEEVTVSYVNPELSLEARRKKLFEEYLFSCFCVRCRKELAEEEEKSKINNNNMISNHISSNNAGFTNKNNGNNSNVYEIEENNKENLHDEHMIDELRAVFT